MTVKNPYRPGVGLQPAYLAGRDQLVVRFRSLLDAAPEIPANARLTGLRGVGKTVLLRKFQEEAEERHWSTISTEIEPRHSGTVALFELILRLTSDHRKRMSIAAKVWESAVNAIDAARKIIRVSFEGFEWSLGGDVDSATKNVAELLFGATKDAVDAKRLGLAIMFDEAQILTDDKDADGAHPLSTLLAAVALLQKQGIPICLVLCGLPTLTVNLLAARTYSERMFRGFLVDSLPTKEAKEAFVRPLEGTHITAASELVNQVVAEVDGYPYFIQLWGAELWDATAAGGSSEISLSTLEITKLRIRDRLDLDFYEPRVDSLTPAEQDLLAASAGCKYPPLRVSELNSTSSKSNENTNVLLGRLVKANVLYRPRKGQYLYTAPGFREYLVRRSAEPQSDSRLW